MPELVTEGDRRSIVAGDFRLVFEWTGDRWTHWLEHLGRVLAVAVEGDPGRDDPSRVVSPAYQQLQFQEAGETLRALLVGQSGPHHFSAVFAVGRAESATSIEVDVADRCRGPVGVLAGTYTVDARPTEVVDAGDHFARYHIGPGELTFAAGEPARIALAEAGRRAMQVQALVLRADDSPTRRLIYSWGWGEGQGPGPR